MASVRRHSEVARIIQASEGGWVIDNADPAGMAEIARILDDSVGRARRGEAGLRFAQARFAPEGLAERFERVLQEVTGLD